MATIENSNPTLSQFRRHGRLGNGVRKQCSSWNLPSSDVRVVGAVNPGSGGGLLGAVKSPDTFASPAELLATTAKGDVAVVTGMVKECDDLILRGMHIDGPGAGSLGPNTLRELAKDLGRQQSAKRVIIHGGIRTTGANPGHVPRPITITVD